MSFSPAARSHSCTQVFLATAAPAGYLTPSITTSTPAAGPALLITVALKIVGLASALGQELAAYQYYQDIGLASRL
jgi:hypothetical protein